MKKRLLHAGLTLALCAALLFQSLHTKNINFFCPEHTQIVQNLWEEGIYEYKGERYLYDKDTKIYLVLGVDSMDRLAEEREINDGGNADAIFLVVVNASNDTTRIINVNRATMAYVAKVAEDGTVLDKELLQICLQHAYGRGGEWSVQETERALSQIYYNIPIEGCISVNMGIIPSLLYYVGDVTVTCLEDMYIANDTYAVEEGLVELTEEEYAKYYGTVNAKYYTAGDPVTLRGKSAFSYLNQRTATLEGADRRTERQKQYMSAAINTVLDKSLIEKAKFFTTCLNLMNDYVYHDVSLVGVAKNALLTDINRTVISCSGQEVLGAYNWVEFYPEEESIMEVLLQTCYSRID